MHLYRSSGVLLHPTSLPGGRLGPEAYRFIDWLAAAGQSWWQILPLGPPDDSGSPYKAASAFAAWRGLLADPDAAVSAREVESFVARHPFWIGDWAAFAGAEAVADQVRFEREWRALHAYAAERGVRLLGDLPIYVAEGGADHLSHPEIFRAGLVAGVPPDAFTASGQLWGNPVYDWTTLRHEGYRWWIERFRRAFELVDLTRLDHFRGFVAYWAVDARRRTARKGTWRRGPGRELFDAAGAALGNLPLVAEDLGVITPAVKRLRAELGFPGILVLQFALDGDLDAADREDRVAYTGTHDNDTAVGWLASAGPRARANLDHALAARRIVDEEHHWAFIRLALSARARLAIVPVQDVLGLGSEARMNYPGRAEGNWRWRLEPGVLTEELGARLRRVTEAARRAPAPARTRPRAARRGSR